MVKLACCFCCLFGLVFLADFSGLSNTAMCHVLALHTLAQKHPNSLKMFLLAALKYSLCGEGMYGVGVLEW